MHTFRPLFGQPRLQKYTAIMVDFFEFVAYAWPASWILSHDGAGDSRAFLLSSKVTDAATQLVNAALHHASSPTGSIQPAATALQAVLRHVFHISFTSDLDDRPAAGLRLGRPA